ncbi:MAG: fibronectin type III domain-containing protein [Chloroflexota bacterium]
MNWMKLRNLFGVIAVSIALFAACEENSNNPVNPGTDKPAKITNLRANSASETSIRLNWDASTSATDTKFKGYRIRVSGGGPMAPIDVGGLAMPYTVTGLQIGTEYTFSVTTVFLDGSTETESDPVTIKWSPAWVFYNYGTGSEMRLYGSSSDLGSGIDLFNSEGKAANLTVAEGAEWDLGFYNREGMLLIGSPSKLLYNWGSITRKAVQIAVLGTGYADLKDIYDSQALNNSALNFNEGTVDLKNYTNNVALVLRIPASGGKYNYAKVLVIRGANGFVQGSSPNEYIKIQASYQPTLDMPYAKVSVN